MYVTDYHLIIVWNNGNQFEETIKKYLMDGWQLWGEMKIITHQEEESNDIGYYREMVKYAIDQPVNKM